MLSPQMRLAIAGVLVLVATLVAAALLTRSKSAPAAEDIMVESAASTPTVSEAPSGPPETPTTEPGPAVRADRASVYDPVAAGEPLPEGFRQLIIRDGITPVYEPKFVPAIEASWDSDDLVIGLEIDGNSKAYPVGFLNRREMVIDRLSGVPVLVTW
jgi:ABC-type transport system substrate-binding protein